MKISKWGASLALTLVAAGFAAACGSSGDGSTFEDAATFDGGCAPPNDCTGPANDATIGNGDDGPSLLPQDGEVTNGDAAVVLTITPNNITLPVNLGGGPLPTQQYTALSTGVPVGAAWTIDRGEIGTIGVSSGIFTPTGALGGTATITASYKGHTATTKVSVKLNVTQIGDPNAPDGGSGAPSDAGADAEAGGPTGGAGGFGGVGGSGEGAGATPAQTTMLNGAATADATVGFVYPYDKTVWPRGILAPLLQWDAGAHAFDAVYIHISETNFEYKGYFQKPAAAATFINHPVPQSVWKQLAYSNQGEDVNVSLVFSDPATGKAVGPIAQTWKIASGSLKGTVYYNSYGTSLAKNLCCAFKTSNKFGGATLAIRGGSTDPTLVAGTSTADDSGCRVCHSVSANGSTLLTQRGNDYSASSVYALTNGNAETAVPKAPPSPAKQYTFQYPAMYPDGTSALIASTTGGTSTSAASGMYSLAPATLGQPITTTGQPAAFAAFTPAFSPDGAHIAYDDYLANQLSVIDYANATKTFSNALALYTPPGGMHAYWPSFMPTNDAIVYQLETRYNGRDIAGTRSGCEDPSGTNTCHDQGTHAELWWVDTKTKTAKRLDAANGVGYLPSHPTATPGDEGKDAELNYEPTVNPVPSGGYAWVVFTSRRRYGNVATINPFHSDPRFRDISTVANATTKKLWVAAIDLNAPPGTDPSHPAFYLPAQELLAGNSRGFWVVDPCHSDGTSCETGDECCGGFCRPGVDGGALTCSAQQPTCAQEFEKCSVTSDCCGASLGITCVNGRCAQQGPK